MAVAGLWLGGCAARSREAVFRDVDEAVRQRTGQSVEWSQAAAAAAPAEVPEPSRELLEQPLTAETAVRLALLNNRNLQAAFEELGIARAELMQAALVANPEFEGSVRTPTDAELQGDPLSPRDATIDLDFSQDVLSLLLRGKRKRVAEARLQRSQSEAVQAVLDLTADVKIAFYELQGAQQMLELRRTVVSATEAGLDVARRLHAAGNVRDLDLANEEALHGQAALELAEAEAALVQARERLRALMGLGLHEVGFTVGERLAEVPAAEPAAEGLESLAAQRHPGLSAARLEVQGLSHALGLTNATRWVPELRLGAHAERESEGEWTFGPSVVLALPLFDQGQARAAQAQAELRKAQQIQAALEAEVRSAVRAAHSRLAAARAKAEYLRTVVLPLRHRILEQVQLEYNAMQVGVFHLLEAKQAEIDAGRDTMEALQEYWRARVELERAIGGALP